MSHPERPADAYGILIVDPAKLEEFRGEWIEHRITVGDLRDTVRTTYVNRQKIDKERPN